MNALHTVPVSTRSRSRLPGRLYLGITLVLIAWSISWFGPTSLGAHTFFPLWLGYILTVDGIVGARSRTSLWARNRLAFISLFFISAPLWWLYEAANVRLQNWQYHLPYDYSWLHYRAESSLAFSTVLPAVFETTELLHTTRLGRWAGNRRRFSLSPRRLQWITAIGLLMIALSMLLPRYFFPLVWIGGFLLIDPINARRGRRSLLLSVCQGYWRPVAILAIAGPICGFFWEMWNIRAMPKWTYDIPFFDWFYLFEMPMLGYGGYIPFAFELYAAYHLFTAVLPERAIARLAIDERGTDSRERTQS